MTPLKFLVILAVSFFVICTAVAIYIYDAVSYGLPSLEQLENPKQILATQVLSSDGELLDHFFVQRRVSLPIDSIPKYFINALISTEDRKFYDHWGIHTGRIINAALKDMIALSAKEGASTITMQLARNLYFNQEGTLKRKLKEALTAIQIERTFTKNEILEMYINTVNFGRGAYGIQVASQVYFDKPANELDLSECAFLVGILKAPENYNGYQDYDKAMTRRNLVLRLMRDQDYISDRQLMNAVEEPINLAKGRSLQRKNMASIAPHYVEMIRQQLNKDAQMKDYDLYRDGLIIYTTLNSKIQRFAQEAVEEHLSGYQEVFNRQWSWERNKDLLSDLVQKAINNYPEYAAASDERKPAIDRKLRRNNHFIDSVKNAATTLQVGLVVMDPFTGDVLAMVGASPKFMKENPDAKYSLNHATQIRRQPGSSFKPFVYACALKNGMTPGSSVNCGPFSYTLPTGEVWSPGGDCEGGGSTSLASALARSINTVAARLITSVTNPYEVINLAKKMGITSNLVAVPAIALGAGGEVSPFEMASAYSCFVNDGLHVRPSSVSRIEDQFGNRLFERKRAPEVSDALDPKIAHEMATMMRNVVDHGTGWEVRKYFTNVEAAGKTGTTNDYADAWFIGYTPQLVAAVWVGFDDKRVSFSGGSGYAAKVAAPIWGRLMAKVYADQDLPYKQTRFSFSKPEYYRGGYDSTGTNDDMYDNPDEPLTPATDNAPAGAAFQNASRNVNTTPASGDGSKQPHMQTTKSPAMINNNNGANGGNRPKRPAL